VTLPRLFAPERLEAGREVRLDQARAHYLGHVLRLRAGARLRLFNPDDGEWDAELGAPGRQGATATLGARVREPAAEPGPAEAIVRSASRATADPSPLWLPMA